MKSSWKRNSLIYIIVLLAAILLFYILIPGASEPEEIPLSQAIILSENGDIKKLLVEDETLLITRSDDTEVQTSIGNLTVVDLKELGFVLPEGGYEINQYDQAGHRVCTAVQRAARVV